MTIDILYYILLGLVAGTISGLLGIGGAVIIIPALVFLFGLSQHQAQGTTLALMVPPIGLLAAWTYYKQGFVDLKLAAFVCLGFFIGGFLGSKFAISVPSAILSRAFGGMLLLIAIKLLIGK